MKAMIDGDPAVMPAPSPVDRPQTFPASASASGASR